MMTIIDLFRRKLPKGKVAWCIGLPYTKEQFLSCCESEKRSDFIDSLELEYRTNDRESLWNRYKPVAQKIAETISFLQCKNVTIISISSPQDFQEAFSHDAVIITAHLHRYKDCLDLMGNSIPVDNIVDEIPTEYHGIVDLSSCYSSTFQMRWKQKRINATYIAAETRSSMELRLFIYEHVIRYMITHPDKNYLQALEVILNRLKLATENTDTRRDVYLGGDIAKRTEGMSASAFAPSEVERGDEMMVQVYVYEDSRHEELQADAEQADKDKPTERSHNPLNFNIQQGDVVTVELSIRHLSEQIQRKSFVWQGKTAKVYFFVDVPEDFDKRRVLAEITLSVNNMPLGELAFATNVTDTYSLDKQLSDVTSKLYKKVFISYSHKDTDVINAIAEAYRALGTVDYFYDRHSLEPGERYEKTIIEYIEKCDLFMLCWSQNAKESKWVNFERTLASNAALEEPPRLRLYPINITPYAAPPEDMITTFHFKDYYKLIVS